MVREFDEVIFKTGTVGKVFSYSVFLRRDSSQFEFLKHSIFLIQIWSGGGMCEDAVRISPHLHSQPDLTELQH